MFPIVPRAKPFPPCVTLDRVFLADELDHLEKAAATATEVGGTSNDRPVRRSKVRWVDFDQSNVWLYQRMAEVVANINAEHYRFDIVGLGEPLQLARYESKDKGHYDWHQDYGVGNGRKLSVTVQLTDPDMYDGGDLELMTSNKVMQPGRDRGLIVVFPAYQLHRVTPVEEGARHSLVAWISGPAFR